MQPLAAQKATVILQAGSCSTLNTQLHDSKSDLCSNHAACWLACCYAATALPIWPVFCRFLAENYFSATLPPAWGEMKNIFIV
jgi:hypothetical protein